MVVSCCLQAVRVLVAAGRPCRFTASSPSATRREFRFVVSTVCDQPCQVVLAALDAVQNLMVTHTSWIHTHQHSNGDVVHDIYVLLKKNEAPVKDATVQGEGVAESTSHAALDPVSAHRSRTSARCSRT
eukprot:TRINITY_DN22525_c1_g1_i2.p1 TRINITY_DN22525_c1_g1~~TRINITY_DN22525_c1_g1_i2.p1  ORF type:complete len:129 (-),score=14.28 TRINITY_DN22525_c1_g1_i2:542-928(-)